MLGTMNDHAQKRRKDMKTNRKKALLLMLSIMIMILALPMTASAKVAINKKSLSLKVGQTATLKIKGTTKKAKWSSNKKAIVTVNQKGKITAKKTGKAVITAKIGKKKYTCKVTVKKAPKAPANASSKKWTNSELTTLNGYLTDAMNEVDYAVDHCRTQSIYDSHINKVPYYLNLAYNLAAKKDNIPCIDGTTLLVSIQHLQFLTETAKSFQSSERIAGRVFYNPPLDATKLNKALAEARNAIAKYGLQMFL